MQSRWRWIVLGLLCLSLAFWALKPRPQKKVFVGSHAVAVEIAKSVAEKERGLSDRPSLCSDCGLLFLFDQPGIYAFWMRKMRFDIDILWIKDNRVMDITSSAKKPSQEDFEAPKTIYRSQVAVDKVLEVNAG